MDLTRFFFQIIGAYLKKNNSIKPINRRDFTWYMNPLPQGFWLWNFTSFFFFFFFFFSDEWRHLSWPCASVVRGRWSQHGRLSVPPGVSAIIHLCHRSRHARSGPAPVLSAHGELRDRHWITINIQFGC